MVITVWLVVAALAGMGATLWPTTSSSERSGPWMCMPSWSPPAFFAATGSGPSRPMEPPSIHGNADNTLCGTLPARIRLPRRTPTSLHWRQGRQHLRLELRKRSKYAELASSGNYVFAPVAIKTLGAWGPCALEICADLGGRIARHTGDSSDRVPQAAPGHCVTAAAVVGTLAEGYVLQD